MTDASGVQRLRPLRRPCDDPRDRPATRPLTIRSSSGCPSLSSEQRDELEALLWYDVCAEYDARFYSAFLRTCGIPLSDAFLEVERHWAADEERHFELLRDAYARFFGWGRDQAARLRARRPDFDPLAHLFADEFAVLCLGTYDELVTVRGYRANFGTYGLLGPDFERLMRRITADEGLHYKAFQRLLREHHAHRLPEVPAQLERIRATEGTPYKATFVLDHDDPVYDEAIYDEVVELLSRRLRPRPA